MTFETHPLARNFRRIGKCLYLEKNDALLDLKKGLNPENICKRGEGGGGGKRYLGASALKDQEKKNYAPGDNVQQRGKEAEMKKDVALMKTSGRPS